MSITNTHYVFAGIIGVVILQRLWEVRFSNLNRAKILKHGGKEHGDNLLTAVKILQVSWWISSMVEVVLLKRPFLPALAFLSFAALAAGQTLRWYSMHHLEWRWTLSIMTLPNMPVVQSGPYGRIRHPNWLGVILEIAFLPLIHSAYLTSIIFSLANAWLMRQRMFTEEAALTEHTLNYKAAFQDIPRFIPLPLLTRNKKKEWKLEIIFVNGIIITSINYGMELQSCHSLLSSNTSTPVLSLCFHHRVTSATSCSVSVTFYKVAVYNTIRSDCWYTTTCFNRNLHGKEYDSKE